MSARKENSKADKIQIPHSQGYQVIRECEYVTMEFWIDGTRDITGQQGFSANGVSILKLKLLEQH